MHGWRSAPISALRSNRAPPSPPETRQGHESELTSLIMLMSEKKVARAGVGLLTSLLSGYCDYHTWNCVNFGWRYRQSRMSGTSQAENLIVHNYESECVSNVCDRKLDMKQYSILHTALHTEGDGGGRARRVGRASEALISRPSVSKPSGSTAGRRARAPRSTWTGRAGIYSCRCCCSSSCTTTFLSYPGR